MRFLLIIPFFPFILNAQTVVIAKKTKNSIIVGADSRTTIYLTDVTTKKLTKEYDSVCKIYVAGKFNFAVVGGFSNENISYAKSACLSENNFDNVIKLYASNMINIISKKLELLRTAFPNTYIETVEKQKPYICQIFFFGYESDTAFLKQATFEVKNTVSEKVKIEAFLWQNEPFAGGHVGEIIDTLKNKNVWKNGVAKTIRNLIIYEEKFHPDEVGGAIQIIKVKRKKVKWISKKPPCI